ncbi:MAG TPA: hypothetical protein VMW49_06095, partial [Candidatus Dormibacteraeota bacterium]|nr:hypothetical protein [Candidatus Dormibacteraeota bacterium]
GMGPATGLLGGAGFTALGVAAAIRLRVDEVGPWRRHRAALRQGWRRPGRWGRLALTAALGLGLLGLFSRALMHGQGGVIQAGYAPTWADWSVHATYASSFRYGHNLPPLNTLLAGTPLRYPFLVDFQSALLMALGQGLLGALIVPSWLLSWAAVVVIGSLAARVTGSQLAATLALGLVLLGGGIGFVKLYPDSCRDLGRTLPPAAAQQLRSHCTLVDVGSVGAALQTVAHLPQELTHLPRYYDGEAGLPPPLPDLQWGEPLLVYWLPQRDFVYGMAMLAAMALGFWVALSERRRAPAVAAGVLGGLIPLFDVFGWVAAVVWLVGWALTTRWWRGLLALGLPLLALGLPRTLFVGLGPHGQAVGPDGPNLFPTLALGWMGNSGTTCTGAQVAAGAACHALYVSGATLAEMARYVAGTVATGGFWVHVVAFWLENTGIFGPLSVVIVAAALAAQRLPAGWRWIVPPPLCLRFTLPAWLLFALGNTVVTQPWIWDNTKILQDWYLLAALPVAGLLAAACRRPGWRLLGAVGVASLVLSGVLTLARSLPGEGAPPGGPAPPTAIPWAGPAERAVARVVRRSTPAGAVFLTEGQPNDPVSTLAGRPLVLGYAGWLWSYGEPLSRRVPAVDTMWRGCPTRAPCVATRLLRRYHVAYIEVEPGDYNGVHPNLAWLRFMRFPVLVDRGGYIIYDVSRLTRRPRP